MKIDYSKWYVTSRDDTGSAIIVNEVEDTKLQLYIDVRKINTDDPNVYIKERAKEEIRTWYLEKHLEQLKGQKLPVEDNLDYIENEAERRGLV